MHTKDAFIKILKELLIIVNQDQIANQYQCQLSQVNVLHL